jgi:multidrug transporter EmrE-like cation transporter
MANAYIGPVPFTILVSIKIFNLLRNKINHGFFIDKNNSNLIDVKGNLKTINLVPLLGNWYGNTAHIILFSFAFRYAKMGDLNQGVIIIMTNFASIFNSFTFYFFFNEKLSIIKIIGMIVCISCVIFLALDSTNKKS